MFHLMLHIVTLLSIQLLPLGKITSNQIGVVIFMSNSNKNFDRKLVKFIKRLKSIIRESRGLYIELNKFSEIIKMMIRFIMKP